VERSRERPLKLGIRAEGDATHRWAFLDCELGEGERALDGLVLERAPWGDLHGRVVDSDGKPLPHIAFALPEMPVHFNTLAGTTDLRDAESDEHGEFLVEDYKGSHGPEVEVKTPGWRLLEKSPTNALEHGGWDPMTVILVPTGTLDVHAVDSQGAPQRNLEVAVWISPREREGRQGSSWWFRLDAQTDEEGRVRFEDVWADRFLVLGVQHEQCQWQYVQHDGTRLIAEGGATASAAAQPLVVPAAGTLELELLIQDTIVLHGRVRDQTGKLVPKACVQVRDAEAPLAPWMGRYHEFVLADAEGRFEVALHPPVVPKHLRWLVADALWDLGDPVLPDSLDRTAIGQKSFALLDFPLPTAASTTRLVEITVAPTLEISGRLVGEDGKPVSGVIRAVPQGAGLAAAMESLTSSSASSRGDGTFSLSGLPAGNYDLLVELDKYRMGDLCLARARFDGIAAGTKTAALKVRDPATVHVHIATECPGRRIRGVEVKLVRIHPRSPQSFVAQRPARDSRIHSFTGWPPMEGYVSSEGHALLSDEIGLEEFFTFTTLDLGGDQTTLDLPPIDPGAYWIGVRAHGASANDYHPTGTGIVSLTASDYLFTFRVDPAADLSGIVTKITPGEELAVALIGAGEAVQCRARSRSSRARTDRCVSSEAARQDRARGSALLQVDGICARELEDSLCFFRAGASFRGFDRDEDRAAPQRLVVVVGDLVLEPARHHRSDEAADDAGRCCSAEKRADDQEQGASRRCDRCSGQASEDHADRSTHGDRGGSARSRSFLLVSSLEVRSGFLRRDHRDRFSREARFDETLHCSLRSADVPESANVNRLLLAHAWPPVGMDVMSKPVGVSGRPLGGVSAKAVPLSGTAPPSLSQRPRSSRSRAARTRERAFLLPTVPVTSAAHRPREASKSRRRVFISVP
jgi:hypothetical protein